MARSFAKFVLFLAILLMPVGMTAAPAAAHGPMTAGMPMEHCPDQAPVRAPKGGIADCTMACAAALPAIDSMAADEAAPIIPAQVRPALSQRLDGLHPETATPPPRRS